MTGTIEILSDSTEQISGRVKFTPPYAGGPFLGWLTHVTRDDNEPMYRIVLDDGTTRWGWEDEIQFLED